jgi:two-component system, cell cycle sensor histidine kinase and response regulator CckA
MPLPAAHPPWDTHLTASLLDGVPCALGLLDEDDRLIVCNPAFSQLFATPSAEICDRPITDFIAPHSWRQACGHPHPEAIRVDCLRADGSPVATALTIRRLAPPQEFRRLLTLQPALPPQPAPPAPDDDHHLEGLATLAGGVAHEFNNLLTIVLGYGNLIPEMAAQPDRLRETIGHIMTAAHRGADVVYQLQLFARTQECTKSPHSLHQLVREGVAHTARPWPATIRVEFALCSAPDVLLLNAPQIILALQHLLQNAREALPLDCGHILLRTISRPDLNPPQLCLSIEDTGIGMDEFTRHHVVEPFFTRHRAGMRGLGLTVVHGIVKAHGGRLEVTSPAHGGTHIRLWLPCADSVSLARTSPLSCIAGEHEQNLLDTLKDTGRNPR